MKTTKNSQRWRQVTGALILVAGTYLACGLSSFRTTHHKAEKTVSIRYPGPLPDSTPITFLSGIVSTDSVDFNAAFSPDGKSFYFTRKENGRSRILFSHDDGKSWTMPTPVDVQDNKYDDADPAFAADGTLYFISDRPKNPFDTIASDYDIWFCNLQIINISFLQARAM